MRYKRLKHLRARSENDYQPLRRSTRIAERLPTQRCDADHLPSSDDEDDAMLQRNRRIYRRVRKPVYDIWDDDNIGADMHDIFAKPPLFMAPMLGINDDEKPEFNETEPEQGAAIDAIEEQPVPRCKRTEQNWWLWTASISEKNTLAGSNNGTPKLLNVAWYFLMITISMQKLRSRIRY